MTSESLDTFFDHPPADLNACDREPIHVPGAIQGHGVLLVAEPETWRVQQVSANTVDLLGIPPEAALGQPLPALVGGAMEGLRPLFDEAETGPRTARVEVEGIAGSRACYAAVHRTDAGWTVELEPEATPPAEATHLLAQADGAMQRLRSARSIEAWCEMAAAEVQRLSGFDRVMVYRFDADWHGQVVAEARTPEADSFLGLHFPAADIPKQARHLYVLNPLRYIADVSYTPVPIVPAVSPATGRPLDLSYSLLRSVSPVHIEYLRNMDVGASMSISIVQDGALWGLIACHHEGAYLLSQPVRAACGLLGHMLSLQLPLLQEREQAVHEVGLQAINLQLFEHMTHASSVAEGLTAFSPTVLDLVAAQGAAIVQDEVCTTVGQTPPEPVIRRLAARLSDWTDEEPFATDRLPAHFDDPESVREEASGLLAIPIGTAGQGWVMWFREEQVRSVTWAGDRRLADAGDRDVRISPRQSFAQWREVVRGTSAPWLPSEVAAARTLQRTIIDVVLHKAEHLTKLNRELATANRALQLSNRELQEFATIVAHDLKEPLRKISTFADLVGGELGATVSEEGRFFLKRLQKSAARLISLVNDLLALAQVTRRGIGFEAVPLQDVASQVVEELSSSIREQRARVDVGALPTIWGDRTQLGQLLFHLLDNALKFQVPGRPPEVRISAEIGQEPAPGYGAEGFRRVCCLTVADNGLGFESRYVERLFKPFQRLHGGDAYEGTGVGLALCRRIVERHNGTIRVESEPGVGSRFTVCLPVSAVAER